MLLWRRFIFYFQISLILPIIQAGFLHSVLGIPTECVYENIVLQCKLSFACWLQGGMHYRGCGGNKWLFSCCVTDNDIRNIGLAMLQSPPKYKLKTVNKIQYSATSPPLLPKRTMLRRKDEENEIDQHVECGIAKTFQNSIQKRIIGGRPARFAEFPWQAHIRIAEFQCGGVLVSKKFVATAAHCIQMSRIQDIVVFLGELDTQNSGLIIEPSPVEKHRILQKIVHPRFEFRMTQPDRFDLALLKLAKPTGFSSYILPICLPTRTIELVGRKGLIAGWGKTAANTGHSGTNILQTASVPIISAADCVKWHESKDITVELFTEMFCAGHSDGHQDACLGDSGGPLIIKENGRYTLIGITSAGFGCGVDHQPGIYHNVQKTAKWIREAIQRNS